MSLQYRAGEPGWADTALPLGQACAALGQSAPGWRSPGWRASLPNPGEEQQPRPWGRVRCPRDDSTLTLHLGGVLRLSSAPDKGTVPDHWKSPPLWLPGFFLFCL